MSSRIKDGQNKVDNNQEASNAVNHNGKEING